MFFFLFQIARDTTGRVFTWGFGGYGRLGHHQPKDEHIPRLVTFFKGKSECKEFVLCVLFYTLKTFDTVVSFPCSFQTLRRLLDICLRILRFKLEDTDRCDVLVIWAVWINVLIPFELCLKYFAFFLCPFSHCSPLVKIHVSPFFEQKTEKMGRGKKAGLNTHSQYSRFFLFFQLSRDRLRIARMWS